MNDEFEEKGKKKKNMKSMGKRKSFDDGKAAVNRDEEVKKYQKFAHEISKNKKKL